MFQGARQFLKRGAVMEKRRGLLGSFVFGYVL